MCCCTEPFADPVTVTVLDPLVYSRGLKTNYLAVFGELVTLGYRLASAAPVCYKSCCWFVFLAYLLSQFSRSSDTVLPPRLHNFGFLFAYGSASTCVILGCPSYMLSVRPRKSSPGISTNLGGIIEAPIRDLNKYL